MKRRRGGEVLRRRHVDAVKKSLKDLEVLFKGHDDRRRNVVSDTDLAH